jgi:hypothetical protein
MSTAAMPGTRLTFSKNTAPTQTHNQALFVGCLTHNLQPKTSFYSWVTNELQVPLAGFHLWVADTFCRLKPTIWVDCGLRFWSVCCPLWVSVAGCSSLLMGCQLWALDCLLWVLRLQVLVGLSNRSLPNAMEKAIAGNEAQHYNSS